MSGLRLKRDPNAAIRMIAILPSYKKKRASLPSHTQCHSNYCEMKSLGAILLLVAVAFSGGLASPVANGVDLPIAYLKTATCESDGDFPNYYNCTTYIQCSNGQQFIKPCPDGLIWNVEGVYCDWAFNTKCIEFPTDDLQRPAPAK